MRRTCPHCHWTTQDFERTGLLGCPECYVAFDDRKAKSEASPSLPTHAVVKEPGPLTSPTENSHQVS